MRSYRKFLMLAITAVLILGVPPISHALERDEHTPPQGKGVRTDKSTVTGYIEEVNFGVIVIYGKSYDISGLTVRDMDGNVVDRNLIKPGSKVELRFKKDRLTDVIYLHAPIGEGLRE